MIKNITMDTMPRFTTLNVYSCDSKRANKMDRQSGEILMLNSLFGETKVKEILPSDFTIPSIITCGMYMSDVPVHINYVDGNGDDTFVFLIPIDNVLLRTNNLIQHIKIPEHVVSRCNDGMCKVVIECTWEGYDPSFYVDLINHLINANPGLCMEHMVVVDSNLHNKNEVVYVNGARGYNHIGVNGFEFITSEHICFPHVGTQIDICSHRSYLISRREKCDSTFLFLSRRWKPSRWETLISLYNSNLMHAGEIGFSTSDFNFVDSAESLSDFKVSGIIEKSVMQCITNYENHGMYPAQYGLISSLPYDVGDGIELGSNPVGDFIGGKYDRTFISIIAETWPSDRSIFFSEKTFKTILSMQPFLLVSTPGSLKALRECGYKTFGDFFDESYDEEPDHLTRIKKVTSVVYELSKLSPERQADLARDMLPILQHNFKTLLVRSLCLHSTIYQSINESFLSYQSDMHLPDSDMEHMWKNMEVIDISKHMCTLFDSTFVQIGAYDIDDDDLISDAVEQNMWKGVYVEPVPHLFKKIKERLVSTSHTAIQLAISNENGRCPIYTVKMDEDLRSQYPSFVDQLSSLDRHHIVSHFPSLDNHIEEVIIDTVTVNTLLEMTNNTELDVLIVDAEGQDFNIIDDLSLEVNDIGTVVFEVSHMSVRERNICLSKFIHYGYTVCIDVHGRDILATRNISG